jgi:primosomal protein N' (replication factor Y)
VGCADCGLILRDPESGSPLSLYRAVKDNVEERWLVSATSGYRIRAKDTCPNCNSWRLRERGIGIQHVESELRKLLPRAPIILFDHTTAKTHAKAEKLKEEFYGSHGTILLGTALALPYLEKPVTTSAVVSMDSLLSLPSWRQTEESFGILLTLREKTDRTVWIQVRHRADEPVIQFAARGEISNFYDEELLVRKEFLYPPYSTFVLLSYSGSLAVIKETEENLGTLFKEQAISFYGMPPNEEGKILRHGLMRLNPKSMTDAAFVSAIHSLSPAIKVEVNPDRIL